MIVVRPVIRQELSIYSTCPPSSGSSPRDYRRRVVEVARWSDQAGHLGILVYSDNSLVDPWLTAQIIVERTESLCPLVAIQPLYMHPFTAAKMISTLAAFHGRRVCLNMLAGGFRNDLLALDDPTPHAERYARTTEYTQILMELLTSRRGVSYEGRYYTVRNLRMKPPMDPDLLPEVLLSGSSEEGREAARRIGATAVRYPEPASTYLAAPVDDPKPPGIRVGILAREAAEEAWRVARARFPADRKGQITHQLAMKVSDSKWHQQLSSLGESARSGESPYWLEPFENHKTFCPYLVGDYDIVAREIRDYLRAGFRTFILDVPQEEADVEHTARVFDRACALLDG